MLGVNKVGWYQKHLLTQIVIMKHKHEITLNPRDATMNAILNHLKKILQDNKITYEVKQQDDPDSFNIIIFSEKSDRKINIELYAGGYNLHFANEGLQCVCHHDMWELNESASFKGESLINLVADMINEKLVGVIFQRGDHLKTYLVEFSQLDKFLKKQMQSLECSHENDFLKNQQYCFLIKSFHAAKDKDLRGAF